MMVLVSIDSLSLLGWEHAPLPMFVRPLHKIEGRMFKSSGYHRSGQACNPL